MTEMVSVIIPMYRDWIGAYTVAVALDQQQLPCGTQLEVIIVDDGSETEPPIAWKNLSHVKLLRLPQNAGRSPARNAGGKAARGQYLVFIDCDCLPLSKNFIALHLEALRLGAIASTGHVEGTGNGFWDRYQKLSSLRREQQHRRGLTCSGSSQNLAVRRSAFEQLGGFDTRYRQYGFEDRDFLVRMGTIGPIAWTHEASVSHRDTLQLGTVAQKMCQAAQLSAKLFFHDHPETYRKLGYASIDARLHPSLRLPARLVGPLLVPIARGLDPWLERLPFKVAYSLVKMTTAGAFLYGSTMDK